MLLLPLLLSCNLGLKPVNQPHDDTGSTPDTGEGAPACTGVIDSATLVDTDLVVVAAIQCADTPLDRWWLALDGTTLVSQEPGGSRADIAETLDLSAYPAGTVVLGLWADPKKGDERELDSVEIRIPDLSSQVDLGVTVLSLDPTSLEPGDPFTVSGEVVNHGTAEAGAFRVDLLLSADEVPSGRDTLLDTLTWTRLAPGRTESFTDHPVLPDTAAGGPAWVLARLTFDDGSTDSNAGNDADAVAVTVVTEVEGLPDTAPDVPTLSVTAVDPGDSLRVTGEVANGGDAATGSFRAGLYLSGNSTWDATDTELLTWSVSSLAAGASTSYDRSVTVPSSTPTGARYVLAVTDVDGDVAEGNEGDNVAWASLTVGGVSAPDIEAGAPSLSAASVAPGGALTVSGVFQNPGSKSTGTFSAGLYLSEDGAWDGSDTALTTWSQSSIAAGDEGTFSKGVTVPTATATGAWYVVVVGDRTDTVTETDEANNTAATPLAVAVPDAPDLSVPAPTLSATRLAPGDTFTVEGAIENVGTDAAGAFTAGIYLSSNTAYESRDTELATWSEGALSAGAASSYSQSVTLPRSTAMGSWYVLVVADVAGTVSEGSEANNTSATAIELPDIDLELSSFSSSDSTGAAGDSVTLSGYVYNYGTDASGAFTLGFYLSANRTFEAGDTLLATKSMGSLGYWDSTSFRQSVTLPAGTAGGDWYLLGVADPDGVLPESDESNNLGYDTFEVARPDLETLHYLSDTYVSPGDTTRSSWTCYNDGAADAIDAVLAWYLSSNPLLDAADTLLATSTTSIPAIDSKTGTMTLTIPADTADGSWYLLFVADPDDLIDESDESDNTDYSPLSVY